MEKTPFHFSVNKIPIELKNVKFQNYEIDENIGFGYMEGNFEFDDLVQIIPTIDERFLNFDFSYNDILHNIENGPGDLLGVTSLQVLSFIVQNGGVFLINPHEKKVLSIPLSLEAHFYIERKIADLDLTDDNTMIVAHSNFNVASMLREGTVIDEDFDESVKYYHRSAKLNHPDANYVLGVLSHQSEQLEQSHNMFLRAARFGHLNAQINVAVNYFDGEIVEQDIESAYYWSRIASNQGDEDGEKLVAQIKPTLTQVQIESLENSITEFESG
jgi:hypothetical protein